MALKRRLFLDMDGVVFNWYDRACEIFNLDQHDPETRELLKNTPEPIENMFGKEYIFDVINGMKEHFWAGIPLLPWAEDVYEHCCSLGDVCFLTSPGKWDYAAVAKLKALKRDFNTRSVLIGKNKWFCASPGAFLIDDTPKNTAAFEENGGKAFLWPNQYKIMDKEISVDSLLNGISLMVNKS